ncbi:MAG TPA: acetyl-CoA hydrolase/transferase C-terminal domain-containing protein [Cyclobacteriaceae bacterium]|nr:acetyl-CoA hydrolase/transferase C-terminal domain-containing protein [Cyclobacteriaceae bacterium]
MNFTTAEEAVKVIKSGDTVFIHGVSQAPQILIDAMINRAGELRNVRIVHIHHEGKADYVKPEYEGVFRLESFFVGANVRKATMDGYADYIPAFLSEIPHLMRSRVVKIDVALMNISPPDKHGYVSLGSSVDISLAAVQSAGHVIAEVNRHVPRTLGDGCMHVSNFQTFVEHDSPIIEVPLHNPDPDEEKASDYVASLVEDGATIQMGIGGIPNAVMSRLMNHKKLGVHTEMFSDGLIPLFEKGVITNSEKSIVPGHIVSSFAMGTKKVYDFIDDNPRVAMMDVSFVNDVRIIRRNPKVTAINSAIEIDLTGQVCADSIGTKHFSGVGGQMDFIRGASYSRGGKPIIALTSRTRKGIPRIVPVLRSGSGVVSTRANVHYVITEYGIAYIYGQSMKERARRLINIAHPEDREMLEKAAFDRWNGHWAQNSG